MEQNSLASFELPSHRHLEGKKASTSFTSGDKKLQLARFYYTLNSVLNHFNDCREKARVLLYNGNQFQSKITIQKNLLLCQTSWHEISDEIDIFLWSWTYDLILAVKKSIEIAFFVLKLYKYVITWPPGFKWMTSLSDNTPVIKVSDNDDCLIYD